MTSPAEHTNLPEVIFLVEEAPEGGFTARALGESIFTEANDLKDLRAKVRGAIHCHFDEGKTPKVIRLHFLREEVTEALRLPRDAVWGRSRESTRQISAIGSVADPVAISD